MRPMIGLTARQADVAYNLAEEVLLAKRLAGPKSVY